MKIGRILIAGVSATVFNVIIGMITCGGVFNWVYKVEPTNVWKPMQGPPSITLFVGTLLINLIFAYIYAVLSKGIPGPNKFVKGLIYGLCIWAVGVLPGMFATKEFMTVANVVIIYWTVWDLIGLPLKGLIVSAICDE